MTNIENIQTQATTAAQAPLAVPTSLPPRDAKLAGAAAQFEQLLVEQLAKQLQETAQPQGDEDGGDGQSAVSGFYSQLLPGALAEGVSGAGGLGLQAQLYDAMSKEAK